MNDEHLHDDATDSLRVPRDLPGGGDTAPINSPNTRGPELERRGSLRVYVASSWRCERQPAVVEAIRRAGHRVYDFRHPAPGSDGFSWKQIDPDDAWLADPRRFVDGLQHPAAQRGFRLDMDALRAADACVLVLPCGNSAHLELGWAVGAGKRGIVLLDQPVSRPELMYLVCERSPASPTPPAICATLEEVIEELSVDRPRRRESVAVAAFVTSRDSRYLLLVQNRERAWELPGGHVEPGESLEHAARREVREETTLEVRLDPDLNSAHVFQHNKHLVVVLRGTARGLPPSKSADPQIERAGWFSRDDIPLHVLSDLPTAKLISQWACGEERSDERVTAPGRCEPTFPRCNDPRARSASLLTPRQLSSVRDELFKLDEQLAEEDELTLAVVKPDGVRRKLFYVILARIRREDLRVVALEERVMTDAQARSLYAEHVGKPFYGAVVAHATSGPSIVAVLAGRGAVEKWRAVMAEVRELHASHSVAHENVVHGADSVASAEREIALLMQTARASSPWDSLTPRQAAGLRRVLQRVASMSSARWDQHLRYEIEDEDADAAIAWVTRELGIVCPESAATACRWEARRVASKATPKLNVRVGSTSEHKTRAVVEACLRLGLNASVVSVSVKSRVADQPSYAAEILTGAHNRATSAWNGESDLAVGIESGIVSFAGTYMDVAVVAVKTETRHYYSTSAGFPFCEEDVAEARRRGFSANTIGQVMAERITGCDPTDGVSHVTGSRMSRAELLEQAVRLALSQWLESSRQEERATDPTGSGRATWSTEE